MKCTLWRDVRSPYTYSTVHYSAVQCSAVICTLCLSWFNVSQISTYKEDFRKEREDRTKNIEKIVQLEARVAELQSKLDTIETKRKREDKTSREQAKELKAAKTSELAQVQAELEAAKEEIAVKVAQVKQYQKQVEAYKQVGWLGIFTW